MKSLEKLQEKMYEIEKGSKHRGYYYKVSDALTIMICGMLCSLQNISDIHEWAKTESVRKFLNSEFNIYKLPSRAQFYNLIGCVDPKKFGALFIEWVEEIVQENDLDRTIAIDGKSICSTSQRTEDGQQMHILSAIVSERKLILGSLPCKTKISEPAVFRELINILDIS